MGLSVKGRRLSASKAEVSSFAARAETPHQPSKLAKLVTETTCPRCEYEVKQSHVGPCASCITELRKMAPGPTEEEREAPEVKERPKRKAKLLTGEQRSGASKGTLVSGREFLSKEPARLIDTTTRNGKPINPTGDTVEIAWNLGIRFVEWPWLEYRSLDTVQWCNGWLCMMHGQPNETKRAEPSGVPRCVDCLCWEAWRHHRSATWEKRPGERVSTARPKDGVTYFRDGPANQKEIDLTRFPGGEVEGSPESEYAKSPLTYGIKEKKKKTPGKPDRFYGSTPDGILFAAPKFSAPTPGDLPRLAGLYRWDEDDTDYKWIGLDNWSPPVSLGKARKR